MKPDFEMCDPCNTERLKTLCDGDTSNNVWYANKQCKLDNLTYDQVFYVLQRNETAQKDLKRITTNANLLWLAANTRLIQDPIEDDEIAAARINNPKQTLPFYYLFRGNI